MPLRGVGHNAVLIRRICDMSHGEIHHFPPLESTITGTGPVVTVLGLQWIKVQVRSTSAVLIHYIPGIGESDLPRPLFGR